jgi:hypothetical protein
LASPPSDWPPHLLGAWIILKDELALPDDQARSIIMKAVSVAQDCVKAQTQGLQEIQVLRARMAIRDGCRRIANCINRAPAPIRRQLDDAVTALLRELVIDTEVMQEILSATFRALRRCPKKALARTALGAVRKIKRAHYEALDIESRTATESALSELAVNSPPKEPIKAANVFDAAAIALTADQKPLTNRHVQVLITRYVANLAHIWRQAELEPSRGISYLNEAYRSKFHRFAELILVEISAPWSLQHELRDLPEEHEPWKAMQDADYQWVVSDYHVRSVLR